MLLVFLYRIELVNLPDNDEETIKMIQNNEVLKEWSTRLSGG